MTPREDSARRELDAELAAVLPDRPQQDSELYPAIVSGVSGDDVIVELAPRVQGAIPLAEFESAPAAGSQLSVALVGKDDGLWSFSIKAARTLAAWRDVEVGSLVKGTVIGVNKAGLELKVSGVRAFLPASQAALHHVEDLTTFAGQTLVCEVLEIDREKKDLVVSRRSVLEEEKRRKREESVNELVVGAVVRGKITRLETYGAFVEVLPGIEGLLHVSNMAHRRVERPDELVKAGETVELQVLEISEGGRRIGLGLKQLQADPWDDAADRLHPDDVLQGTVRRIVPFGAFVELEPGVEGLLHVSQIGQGRIHNPGEVVKVGQKLPVRLLSVDGVARRISLSRLDARGAELGSEEAAAGADVEQLLKREPDRSLGTNLGSLFKKALKDKA